MKERRLEYCSRLFILAVLVVDLAIVTPCRFLRHATHRIWPHRSRQTVLDSSLQPQQGLFDAESPTSAVGCFEGIDLYDYVNPAIVGLYAGEGMVLDIGCGSGALGGKLKSINPKAIVYGIDVSQRAEQRASNVLDRFDLVDLDNEELPDYGLKFDLIILADILEHLKRPDLLMLQLRRHLTDEGSILVSLPNVAHFHIRVMLLYGEFEYTGIGILDRTHLRFFTHKTLRQLVEQCGFNIAAERHSFVVPGMFGHSPRAGSRSYILLTRNFPNLFAYQFIAKLECK
jgi:2-polyprenyl-3-methyl-5-hydroxy-6-metoxy-1,4-benzoquinol methylase